MSLRDLGGKLSVRFAGATAKSRVIGILPSPRDMSDAELLRFGTVAKYMCSQKSGLDEKQREIVSLQLNNARNEWARRFPSLPLSSTFDEDDQEPASAAASRRPRNDQLLLIPSRQNK
jgi:hypothetical protein